MISHAREDAADPLYATQNTNRKPIWPCLGLLYWLLITPNVSLPNVVFGMPNLGG